MKKEDGIKKIKKVEGDSKTIEVICLADIASIYKRFETDRNDKEYYKLVTIFKNSSQEKGNILSYKYYNEDEARARLDKILFFMVTHKGQLKNEFLVVREDGIFLSAELDFSEFDPNTVTK